jgi:hypothetical protein
LERQIKSIGIDIFTPDLLAIDGDRDPRGCRRSQREGRSLN